MFIIDKFDKDFILWKTFLNKYNSHPSVCSYCGKLLTIQRYIQQFEYSNRFCNKRCKTSFIKTSTASEDKFSSETEKLIYNRLIVRYPDEDILHNVKDLIFPYEIDFFFKTKSLVIEYNGTLHFDNKRRGKTNKTKRIKTNDIKKRNIICLTKNLKLIRIWSELGLFTRRKLFNRVLEILYKEINKIKEDITMYGWCVDIEVNIEEKIDVYVYTLNDLEKTKNKRH